MRLRCVQQKRGRLAPALGVSSPEGLRYMSEIVCYAHPDVVPQFAHL